MKEVHDPAAYVCDHCRRRLAKRILAVARIWPALLAACGRMNRRTIAGSIRKPPTPEGPTCERCTHATCGTLLIGQVMAEYRAARIANDQALQLPHEEPLLVDLDAIESKDVAWSTFTTWARHIAECRSLDLTADTQVLTFLARQSDWLMHRREAEEAYDELIAACRAAETAVDNLGVEMSFCGPCDVCGRDLFAPAGADDAYCRPCDLTYPLGPRRDLLMERTDSQIMTAVELSRALTTTGQVVTPAVIANWADRGRLLPRGRNARGNRLYAVRDVRDLVRERDSKANGRRTRARKVR